MDMLWTADASNWTLPALHLLCRSNQLTIRHMFEMQPFWPCPKCTKAACFGVLSVGERAYRRRCTQCQHVADYWLDDVDKKVIYLDQFAISEVTKAQTRAPHELKLNFPRDFWLKLGEQVQRLLLLQQAIFPDSEMHSRESIVSAIHAPLREQYESINGDVSFKRTTRIQHDQVLEFAKSWLDKKDAPKLNLCVDTILRGERNRWLDNVRISVSGTCMRILADDIREQREDGADRLARLFLHWGDVKPKFETALQTELEAIGNEYVCQITKSMRRAVDAIVKGDGDAYEAAIRNEIIKLNERLLQLFDDRSVPEGECQQKVLEFLMWPSLRKAPSLWIEAHLFAALASKAASGQKRPPSKGMLNDIRAISGYAPYVDAMFVDNECANLLREIGNRIEYKAKIFSTNTKDAFLKYLRDIDDATPPEVRKQAQDVYGLL
jgi:hypothetical protein